jgi:uncharacterized protein (DUF934 family)
MPRILDQASLGSNANGPRNPASRDRSASAAGLLRQRLRLGGAMRSTTPLVPNGTPLMLPIT